MKTMRTAFVLALLGACVLCGTATARPAAIPSCGTVSFRAQNGNQLFILGTGPTCLYRDYGSCRAAVLTLQGHGVDTMLQLQFTVGRLGGACRVAVAGSNTVFFGSRTRKTTWSDSCTAVTKRPEGVVLGGCAKGDYLLSPPGAAQVPNNRF
jgi:hypothetical protein